MNGHSNITESEFNEVYERLAPRLVAFANRWTGDKIFAEDVVQDAFVQIWQKRHSIKDFEKVDTLLYTIVRNNLINHYQKRLREQAYLAELSIDFDTEKKDEPTTEKLKLVNQTLNALPPKSKEVFLMSRKDGLTYREIASELSISIKSVEKHISKALKFLRKHTKQAFLFFL